MQAEIERYVYVDHIELYNDFHPSQTRPDQTTYITEAGSNRFLEQIEAALNDGRGFVPLIGAGFSAPAGAPILSQWMPYLARCICMALAIGPGTTALTRHWNPRADGWPSFFDPTQQTAKFWERKLQENLQCWIAAADSTPGKWQRVPLLKQAYGAMAEWRAALQFLSRIEIAQNAVDAAGSLLVNVKLGEAQQEVIDTGLRELFRDVHPALNHNMLAMLADSLRQDILLTTNFDTLLERAFAAALLPLQVFDVAIGGDLPQRSALQGVRSIVKLHGTRVSLRADFSLDRPPSEQDKERFLSYLYGPATDFARMLRDDVPLTTFQNHLLVMGFSADDRRIREFIRFAAKHLPPEFRIFWVCYTDSDIAGLRAAAPDMLPDRPNRLHLLRHTEQGLLLLQLYQRLSRTLPPRHALMPSTANLCLPPLPASAASAKAGPLRTNTNEAVLEERLADRLGKRPEADTTCSLLTVITSPFGVPGVLMACARAAQDLRQNHIWIEMGAVFDVGDLFEEIVEAVYNRLGRQHWTPRNVERKPEQQAKEIKRIIATSSGDWVLFLNARMSPGRNVLCSIRQDEKLAQNQACFPHGWIDDGSSPGNLGEFVRFILELSTHRPPPGTNEDPFGDQYANRVAVVLLTYTSVPLPGLTKGTAAQKMVMPLDEALRTYSPQVPGTEWLHADPNGPASSLPDNIAQTLYEELKTPSDARNLFALVLARFPRHPAMLRAGSVCVWPAWPLFDVLSKPEYEEALRYKAGGFLWLHTLTKAHLRTLLRQDARSLFPAASSTAALTELELHGGLAQWYVHLQRASNSPSAVLEAVYHRCMEAQLCLTAGKTQADAAEALRKATHLLRTSLYFIQTQGNPRGSRSRLAQLCKACELVLDGTTTAPEPEINDAATAFELARLESLRSICRELGFEQEGYEHHRACAGLLHLRFCGTSLKTNEKGLTQRLWKGLVAPPSPYAAKYDWSKRQIALMRWLKWSRFLAVAERRYDLAEEATRRGIWIALASTAEDAGYDIYCMERGQPDDPYLGLHRRLEAIAAAVAKNHDAEWRLVLLQLMERAAELNLHRAALARRSGKPLDSAGNNQRGLLLKGADEIVTGGLKLAQAMEQGGSADGVRHATASAWAKDASAIRTRLLEHRSVCQAYDEDAEVSGNAMKSLTVAATLLQVSDPHRYHAELAILDMFRAQVTSIHAGAEVFATTRKLLDELTLSFEPGEAERAWQEAELCAVLDSIPAASRSIEKSDAYIRQSISFLQASERVLRERRRSVLWTTWYFERNLRSMAFAAWLSVFQLRAQTDSADPKRTPSVPLPYLGPQSAAEHIASPVDELFEDAFRMITHDRYRMATIVSAYLSCARALCARRLLDPAFAAETELRRDRMRKGLRHAYAELTIEIPKRRREAYQSLTWIGQKSGEETAFYDPEVLAYIKQVEEACRHQDPDLTVVK